MEERGVQESGNTGQNLRKRGMQEKELAEVDSTVP